MRVRARVPGARLPWRVAVAECRPVRRLFVVVCVVVLLLVVAHGLAVGPVLVQGTRAIREAQAELATRQRTFAAAVMADQRRWAGDPLFAPRDGGDAAALLFQHVAFEGRAAPQPLPAEVVAGLKDAGADWPRATLDVSSLDLGWMAQLAGFGFWDVEGPQTPLSGRPFEGMTEPIPRFTDVLAFSKARLLKGLASGDVQAALDDVHELSRLCLTTELLVGDMVAVALLGLERQAAEEAARRGLDLGGRQVMTEADQQSLKRALWVAPASTALLAPTTPLDPRFPLVGRCSAERELASALLLRPWAEPLLPERYRQLGDQLAQSPCRLRRLRAAWQTTGEGELPLSGAALCDATAGGGSCDVPDFVTRLPFVRPAVGAVLVSTATTDWFRLYDGDGGAP